MKKTVFKDINSDDRWGTIKSYSANDFSRVLAEYDYRSDPVGGLFDFSPRDKNYFFHDKEIARDCDDWSRMWYWWGIENNYEEVYEISLVKTNPAIEFDGLKPRLRAHMVTVMKVDDKYQLFDYRPVAQKEDSIDEVLKHNNVGYDKLVWCINKEVKYEN
jgi:hypothetical protein